MFKRRKNKKKNKAKAELVTAAGDDAFEFEPAMTEASTMSQSPLSNSIASLSPSSSPSSSFPSTPPADSARSRFNRRLSVSVSAQRTLSSFKSESVMEALTPFIPTPTAALQTSMAPFLSPTSSISSLLLPNEISSPSPSSSPSPPPPSPSPSSFDDAIDTTLANLFAETLWFKDNNFANPPACLSCCFKVSRQEYDPDTVCDNSVIWKLDSRAVLSFTDESEILKIKCNEAKLLQAGEKITTFGDCSYAYDLETGLTKKL